MYNYHHVHVHKSDVSWRFQKYVSWTRITIQSSSEKKTRVKDLPIMKMRRNNRRTRVNKPRNWIQRKREFVSFLPMQGTRSEGRRGVSTYREIPYGWNLTIVDSHEYIVQKDFFFSAPSICLPLPCQLTKAPVFGVSVQRPWPLARGDANELR